MIHVKAPLDYAAHRDKKSVFLAGSIEMGAAEEWQDAVANGLSDTDVLVLNPRRNNWDSSWVQSMDNPQFREQVEWELSGIEAADIVAFYFSPSTKAPISMLELGIQAARAPQRAVVCCPHGFWRKGNVDIVCAHHNVRQVGTLEALVAAVKERLG